MSSEYHDDGQCDYIYTQDCSRCLRNASWLHIPTGLCYCNKHTDYYHGKIEAGWKPI